MEIDESSFTGETLHSRKHSHPEVVVGTVSFNLLKNMAFMGSFVCSGNGKVFIFNDLLDHVC